MSPALLVTAGGCAMALVIEFVRVLAGSLAVAFMAATGWPGRLATSKKVAGR
jgi:hypothetical protein